MRATAENRRVALLVGILALLGVLPRPALEDVQEALTRGLRSLVGALAFGTAAGAFCRLTGLDLRWAVPQAPR
ncbi:hypothetical protein [Deinococcus sp.]|uniref:hypothetical protein n=1 Tax=Deinococcus sp. TaxID=47478 RepID=UPI003C79AD2E